MYVDVRKFDYRQFGETEAAKLVQRDKKYAKDAYKKWVEENLDEIVDRQWEIDDVGVIERVGDFIKLLKEAEFTYAMGAYTSTLALVGVCAEDLCRFFARSAGQDLDSESQHGRVNRLLRMGALTQAVADNFDMIRQLRNNCLHYSGSFKQKEQSELRRDALLALNVIKRTYAEIIGAVDYKTVNLAKFSEIVEAIAQEGADKQHMGTSGLETAVARTRNLFSEVLGVDLSVNEGGQPEYRLSVYEVMEIDEESEPPELTLMDKMINIPVIVDITNAELEEIQQKHIDVGDLVAVSLKSVSNPLGMTGIWRLWSRIEKIS